MPFDEAAGRLTAPDRTVPVAGAHAIEVADGDYLDARVAEKSSHVAGALIAGSDDGHGDTISGRGPSGLSEGDGGDERGRLRGGQHLQEGSAFHVCSAAIIACGGHRVLTLLSPYGCGTPLRVAPGDYLAVHLS